MPTESVRPSAEVVPRLAIRDPDQWLAILCWLVIGYASLQMLEQAVEKVGKIDREAIIKELSSRTFDTVIGKVKLENNIPVNAFPLIGQWQKGFFTGVAPSGPGMAAVIVPKPAWGQ